MYVCICNTITDHKIKEAVSAGASSLTDLKDKLGVATCCGCCADLVSSFLNVHPTATKVTATTSIAVEH